MLCMEHRKNDTYYSAASNYVNDANKTYYSSRPPTVNKCAHRLFVHEHFGSHYVNAEHPNIASHCANIVRRDE